MGDEETLAMNGTTYLRLEDAATLLGFENVEEMLNGYSIQIVSDTPDGQILLGKPVKLRDLINVRPKNVKRSGPFDLQGGLSEDDVMKEIFKDTYAKSLITRSVKWADSINTAFNVSS